jgi:hypothetical protein
MVVMCIYKDRYISPRLNPRLSVYFSLPMTKLEIFDNFEFSRVGSTLKGKF